ncbi:MAG: hypothetical protein R2694_10905 [Ilumatobacteraceae bacterium]
MLADFRGMVALAVLPSLLHGEHVGEVGRHLQCHLDRGFLLGGVADLDDLVPHLAHLAAAHHHQAHIGSVHRMAATDERGGTRIGLVHRKRLDRRTADQQAGPAEHAHVGEEDPVGGVGVEVAGAAAEAERLPVDEGDERARVAQAGRMACQDPRARGSSG